MATGITCVEAASISNNNYFEQLINVINIKFETLIQSLTDRKLALVREVQSLQIEHQKQERNRLKSIQELEMLMRDSKLVELENNFAIQKRAEFLKGIELELSQLKINTGTAKLELELDITTLQATIIKLGHLKPVTSVSIPPPVDYTKKITPVSNPPPVSIPPSVDYAKKITPVSNPPPVDYAKKITPVSNPPPVSIPPPVDYTKKITPVSNPPPVIIPPPVDYAKKITPVSNPPPIDYAKKIIPVSNPPPVDYTKKITPVSNPPPVSIPPPVDYAKKITPVSNPPPVSIPPPVDYTKKITPVRNPPPVSIPPPVGYTKKITPVRNPPPVSISPPVDYTKKITPVRNPPPVSIPPPVDYTKKITPICNPPPVDYTKKITPVSIPPPVDYAKKITPVSPPLVDYTKKITHVKSVGKRGEGPCEFNYPFYIAIDETNSRVYVSDCCNSRVQVLSLELEFITVFGKQDLNWPRGIAIYGNFIFLNDDGLSEILKYELPNFKLANRNGQTEKGKLLNPRGLASDSNGDIYIAERNGDRLSIFNKDLKFNKYLGEKQLKEPLDVNLSHDKVYVVDKSTPNVHIFNKIGVKLSNIIKLTSGGGTLSMCIDRMGYIIVSDAKAHSIQIYTQEGALIHSINYKGNAPLGVAVTNNQSILCAFNHIIYLY